MAAKKLPRAVQAQKDAVAEKEAEFKAQLEEGAGMKAPKPPEDSIVDVPPVVAPVVEEPKFEKPVAAKPEEIKTEEPKVAEALDSKLDGLKPKDESLELAEENHKLKSDAGRKDKAIQDLQTEVAELSQALKEKQPEAALPDEIVSPDLFTEEDKVNLGEDYIEMANKAVANGVRRGIAAYKEQIDARFDTLAESTNKGNEQVFWDRVRLGLGLSFEQWDKIDKSAQFESYLRTVDDSGNIRNDSLDGHLGKENVDGTVMIYKNFMDTLETPVVEEVPMQRVPQPTMSASGGVPEVQKSPLNYTEVANLFTSGKITAAQKDAYINMLDAEQLKTENTQ